LIFVKTEECPTPDEAKRLSLELSTLSERQYEALKKAPYLLNAANGT
jgi:hypothetical protein